MKHLLSAVIASYFCIIIPRNSETRAASAGLAFEQANPLVRPLFSFFQTGRWTYRGFITNRKEEKEKRKGV
jgi:hypothetical protein